MVPNLTDGKNGKAQPAVIEFFFGVVKKRRRDRGLGPRKVMYTNAPRQVNACVRDFKVTHLGEG